MSLSEEIYKLDDGFTVVSKKKSYRKIDDSAKYEKLKICDVVERSKCVLSKYNPYAAYLYGSTAREKNRHDSDIDIFVIWKNHIPQKEIIDKMHDEIRQEFKRRVDLVNYHYNGKIIKVKSGDSCFIQNIILDAVSIVEPHDKYKVIDDILFDYDCYF